MQNNQNLIPAETIVSKIFVFRGKKVMLDKDLAKLYEVETKMLKRAACQELTPNLAYLREKTNIPHTPFRISGGAGKKLLHIKRFQQLYIMVKKLK